MTLRLYTQRLNPFAQKVAIALDIKKLPYEWVVSDTPEDIKRWSPVTGELPVLEDGAKRIADSTAILQHLDERYPVPPLRSRDPKVAAAQDQLMEWADASLLFYWDRWRAARFPRPGDDHPANPSLLRKLQRRIERSFGSADVDPTPLQLRELEVLEELAHRMDDLVGMLGQRHYFHANEPSVADASVFGMLRIIRDGPMMSGNAMIIRRPALAKYVDRMEAICPRPTAATSRSLGE
ncbi:MAG: glutathione S-transferase family protein [Myxococcota bacterium]|nr:glutathione S-transferase family protein [Myxococcota bacterium]